MLVTGFVTFVHTLCITSDYTDTKAFMELDSDAESRRGRWQESTLLCLRPSKPCRLMISLCEIVSCTYYVYIYIYILQYGKHIIHIYQVVQRDHRIPDRWRSLNLKEVTIAHHRNVSGVNDSDFCGVCSALVPGVRSQLLIISNRIYGNNGIFSYIDPEISWVVSKILHPWNLTWILDTKNDGL